MIFILKEGLLRKETEIIINTERKWPVVRLI